MSRRWWRCETKGQDRIDVLEWSPKQAACEAVESWLSLEEEDDEENDWLVSSMSVLVTPVDISGEPDPGAKPTRWRVEARKRISYSTEAEEVIE